MDWSKYTDEGWYGDAAIRFYQLGHWYVAGDFNPAVALPVWPFFEAMLFHFTGVSLVGERALTVSIFGGILVCSWILVASESGAHGVLAQRRTSLPQRNAKGPRLTSHSLAATIAVLFLAANPFCFVFTRLGILEPLLVLETLLALLAVRRAKMPRYDASITQILSQNLPCIFAGGLLFPAIILTKTTGLFLVPAVLWLLFAVLDYRRRPFLIVAAPLVALACSLWGAYFVSVVRPHYLVDYRYLFSANAYTGITRSNWLSVIGWTLHGAAWIGRALSVSAAAAILIALLSLRLLRSFPILSTLIVWAAGYFAFLAYHNNLQPRYYLVVAVPLTLLVPTVCRDLVVPRLASPFQKRAAALMGVLLVSVIAVPDAFETLHFVRHPEYTFVTAAHQIADYIRDQHRKDPRHSPLVLSISGSDISLMTGIPSICDDYGTAELADRARQYTPGWDITWNLLEDDKMDALTPTFHVERVATFAAMDDQDRNQLVLYRLDLASEERSHSKRSRRLHPRLGRQPSPLQLGH